MKKGIVLLSFILVSSACFSDSVLVHSTVVFPDSVMANYTQRVLVKEGFWEKIAPSLITAVGSLLVSLLAVTLTMRTTNKNTERNISASKESLEKQLVAQNDNFGKQLKAQLATTIAKQEIEIIRGCTAKCIEKYLEINELRGKPEYKDLNIATLRSYKDLIAEFRKNHIMLNLYLNFNEPLELEKGLSELINELWGICTLNNRDISRKIQIIDDIQTISHLIFENKLGLI